MCAIANQNIGIWREENRITDQEASTYPISPTCIHKCRSIEIEEMAAGFLPIGKRAAATRRSARRVNLV